jgi:chitinase
VIARAVSTLSRIRWRGVLGAIAAASLAIAAGCGEVADGPADGGDAGSSAGAIAYAPYYYAYGWGNPAYAFSSPADMKAKGGPAAISLAFVLSNGGCDASTDIHDHLGDVRAYIAAGGHVRASFGGATGTYLETACGSAAELATALGRFVDDTGITDLDFDLEQHAVSSNATVNARRAVALKQVQDAKHVRVALTLPVAPTGLLQESLDILQAVIAAGVEVSIVNGLAMDFGNGTDLATVPMQAIDGLAQQLRGVMPGLSIEQAYRRVGGTVMIGKNDDDETLSLASARGFVDYARAKQLGFVSFWAIQRDQPCPPSNDVALCSRLNTQPFEFHAIFAGVNR